MGVVTGISWTDSTWNPISGCSMVSKGCMNCYAEKIAARFSWAPDYSKHPGPYFGLVKDGKWNGQVDFSEHSLLVPLKWKKPRRIFVNSMSDLFHENVPDEWIDKIFAVMALAPRHTFQILTKRPKRMLEYFSAYHASVVELTRARLAIDRCSAEMNGGSFHGNGWPLPNVWLGVSVEDQETADERIPLLLQVPAAIRFVSYEPALAPVNFRLGIYQLVSGGSQGISLVGLDWIIVGGESGPNARPFDFVWARQVISQCRASETKCFIKQLGSKARGPLGQAPYSEAMNLKDRAGADPSEWPKDLRVQEFPS